MGGFLPQSEEYVNESLFKDGSFEINCFYRANGSSTYERGLTQCDLT